MKHLFPGILVALFAAASAPGAGAGEVEYNRDIRPILADNCFACHGPDSASRKAGLRLDSFEAATAERDGEAGAIIPGKPDESSVIARILTADHDDIMPPAETKKTLSSEQKDLLKRWVAQGAQYEAHWSFQTPSRPEVPKVKNEKWVSNPIDAFVLARLEKEGLSPEPEADRATLARRVSLDLTGLPPSPELVEAFERDSSPNAYEKLVDLLMSTPQYGEHRARYWLDAARYADTHGIHFDNYREVWSYREWVINALNDNMPFDQFTVEQLAGDLLPQPTLDQKIATGFNRCNMTTSEGGAINEEYLVLYTRDRTETTSSVWMGLTAGCAVCHDHKYDPLSQKEFYEISAFFNNTTQPAMDGNRKDTPPIIVVPAREDRARWAELPQAKDKAKKRIERRRQSAIEDFAAWQAQTTPESIMEGVPVDGLTFLAPLKESTQSAVTVMVNGYPETLQFGEAENGVTGDYAFKTSKENVPTVTGAGDFERDQAFSVALWVKMHPDDKSGAVLARMDGKDAYRGWDIWFEEGKVGTHIVHKWPEDGLKVVTRAPIEPNKWTHVLLSYNGSSKAEGVTIYINGEVREVDLANDKLQNTIRTQVPLKIGQRDQGDHLEKALVQDVRIYSRVLNREEAVALKTKPRLAYLVSKTADQRTEEERKALYDEYLNGYDQEFQTAVTALAALETEDRDIRQRGTIAHVMNEKPEPAHAYLLFRGEYDKRRDRVDPNTPAMLPRMAEGLPKNRLGFAKWLLQPDHPLTSRVTVNRMWQELFGNGIVRTPGDFGITGELPSHQDLLDWLAVDFRQGGWDMKRMYKMMVMSSTYRQSNIITPEKLAKDRDNRLLARGPRFRLDGEMIRDYALAASGLLSRKVGGPSVRPYQPEGVWEVVGMPDSDTRNYKRDSGEKLYRRSLYTFWKRMAPPATMDVLNAPSREACTVKRERTNTPLQALATLNDPQFVEAARVLAERSLAAATSAEERLNFMAERLLARPFSSQEREIVQSVLVDLESHYKEKPDDAKELIGVGESEPSKDLEPTTLAAYTMVANQLMNLDEVLNK